MVGNTSPVEVLIEASPWSWWWVAAAAVLLLVIGGIIIRTVRANATKTK